MISPTNSPTHEVVVPGSGRRQIILRSFLFMRSWLARSTIIFEGWKKDTTKIKKPKRPRSDKSSLQESEVRFVFTILGIAMVLFI